MFNKNEMFLLHITNILHVRKAVLCEKTKKQNPYANYRDILILLKCLFVQHVENLNSI